MRWVQVAKQGQPNDTKVKELHDEIKAKHDRIVAAAEESKEPVAPKTTEEKLLSRVKIEDESELVHEEPKIEEVKTQPAP